MNRNRAESIFNKKEASRTCRILFEIKVYACLIAPPRPPAPHAGSIHHRSSNFAFGTGDGQWTTNPSLKSRTAVDWALRAEICSL